MKKIVYASILAGALIVSGCAKKYIDESSDQIDKISFKAEDLICDSETKIYPNDDFTKFLWSENDTVGIYPDEGSQVAFPIGSGEKTGTAVFDGGGWHFNVDATYYSYYPFSGNIYLDRNKIPVNFEGQRQDGTDERTHVGSHWYMCTSGVSAKDGILNFTYSHLSSLFSVRLKLDAGTYKRIAISSPDKIFVKNGYFDLQSNTPSIVATEYTDSVIMDLDNVILSAQSEFKALLVTAPVSLKGVTLTISVYNDNNEEIKVKKTLASNYTLVAGHVCQLNCSDDITWLDDAKILTIKHSEKSIQVPNLGSVTGTVKWDASSSAVEYNSSLTHDYGNTNEKTMTLNWKDGDGFEIKELSSISDITLTLTE